ncbi:MAG: EamA family transporter [Thermomicrobiales bacterium]
MAAHTTGNSATRRHWDITGAIPPHAFFLVSAIFHYLGPAFAVLLFAHVDVLGVAWLRIASAAAVFAVWRRPWRVIVGSARAQRHAVLALGAVLGAMNVCFYLAIARLPLGTVGAIEFLGPIALAAFGLRRARNFLALGLVVAGIGLLTDVRLAGEPLGFAFAFANSALFLLYVVLGHRIAQAGGGRIDLLGAAMIVALVTVTPFAVAGAAPAFTRLDLLLAGVGVGICSSVVPYVCDQLAMARLPRATFALLLALLPACAAAIGFVVLRQQPHPVEVAGIALIVCAVAIHREPDGSGAG